MYGMIATWKMALDAVKAGSAVLAEKDDLGEAITQAVVMVEDEPAYKSVGFGGLPNCLGEVELDAAYMDGDTLNFGAVISAKNIKNPIKVARHLSNYTRNNVLAARGAEMFAERAGYELSNMLTKEAKKAWADKGGREFFAESLTAYDGHDTVCVIALNSKGSMGAGVSTSGLFMKHPGRTGDSPVIGSGFYCDSEVGGAAATGVGEDIMKGCLSFCIVSLMKSGIECQKACETALSAHVARLMKSGRKFGDISVIAMDNKGKFGAATNKEEFPFVVSDHIFGVRLMAAKCIDGKITVMEADESWLNTYKGD